MGRSSQLLLSASLVLGIVAAYVWWQRHPGESIAATLDPIHQTLAPLPSGGAVLSMKLQSTSFKHESDIPQRHTCEGTDAAPALAWSGAPPTTKSFALVVDDPDAPDPRAPKTVWVHWVLYGMPPVTLGTPEGATKATLPPGTREGKNDWKQTGWRGPCPPIGRHRYFFKLYALDTMLPDLGTPTKAELEKAMDGHIVGQATLVGYYKKAK